MSEAETPSTANGANEQQPRLVDIAGNLWWDDVRQAFVLFSIGLSIFTATVLLILFVPANFLTTLGFIAGGALMLLGGKMMISAPSESKATLYAIGVLGCVAGGLVLYVVEYFLGRALGLNFAPAALVLGAATVIPFAFYIRKVGAALNAPALEGASWLLLFVGAIMAVAIIATGFSGILTPDAVSPFIFPVLFVTLSVLLAGYIVYLSTDACRTIELAQNLPEVEEAPQAEATPSEPPEKPSEVVGEEVAGEPVAEHLAEHAAAVSEPENVDDKTGDELFGEQWPGLRADDKSAGRAVVGLMTVIFAVGVVLYLIIAIQAA